MANEPIRVKVPCRICYVKLAEPVVNEKSGKSEYSVQCRMKEDDKALVTLRKKMKQAFIEKFGDNKTKWPKAFREEDFFETYLSKDGKDGFFLRDGNWTDNDDMKGVVYFTARESARQGKTPRQPRCGKMLGEGRWVALTGSRLEEELYSGCYADVVIDLYAYDNENKGVGCSLKAVMKTADGDRLSGGAPVDMAEFFGDEASVDELDAGTDDDLDV